MPVIEVTAGNGSLLPSSTYAATLTVDGAVAAGALEAEQAAIIVAEAQAAAADRTAGGSVPSDQSTSAAPVTISANSGECAYREALLPATDPAWGGNDATTGTLMVRTCNGPSEYLYVPTPPAAAGAAAAPAPPPPPDPAVLAQQAYAELSLPAPDAYRSPSESNSDPDHGGLPFTIVGLRTWFWVGDWQPLQRTVELQGVSVTLTATPVEVHFDPGNGDSVVACAGPGRAWTPADGNAAPTNGGCAYTYTRVSPDRPLTATTSVQWQVDWTSNSGADGTFPDGVSQVSDQLLVEQIQVVVR
ncbi:hypothetical protein [Nakamurella multipartita]|uniref:Histone methyltransferase n=1 Tax=Nakamurella multipartita (strain ATCC 700099 / DSM 44233 / CIP 104796 / JCM 9543 / NBRC 105858 / Y-104) TaxID=479431 RepID=C8X8Q6_NAKMY|nr:hypothetical protein [Nakamurella multipartita]ACV79111.1 histone methyltransferase [Nakamurella multipartita DSM 44233]